MIQTIIIAIGLPVVGFIVTYIFLALKDYFRNKRGKEIQFVYRGHRGVLFSGKDGWGGWIQIGLIIRISLHPQFLGPETVKESLINLTNCIEF